VSKNKIILKELSNKEISLKPVKLKDLNDIFRVFSNEFGCFNSQSPHIKFELTREAINTIVKSNLLVWSINLDNKIIGLIQINCLENDYSSCTIEYYICNRGVDKELILSWVKDIIVDYLQNTYGIENFKYEKGLKIINIQNKLGGIYQHET